MLGLIAKLIGTQSGDGLLDQFLDHIGALQIEKVLIAKCLCWNPDDRIGIDEIVTLLKMVEIALIYPEKHV